MYDATRRTTKPLTVSVPPEAAEDFDRIAAKGRNRSELFRETLAVCRIYLETRMFESLQRHGAALRREGSGRRRMSSVSSGKLAGESGPRYEHPDLSLRLPGRGPEAVYRAALEGRFELVASPPLLAELGRVVADDSGWEGSMAEAAVAQVARIGTVVRPRQTVSVIVQDPADNRVLGATTEGEANAIVPGD